MLINLDFYWQVDILDGNVTRDNYGVLVIQSPSTPPEHEHDEIHGFSNPNYNAAYGGKSCVGLDLYTVVDTGFPGEEGR